MAAVFVLPFSPMSCPWCARGDPVGFTVRPPTDLYVLSASVMDFLVPNRLHTGAARKFRLDRQPDRR
ncbi:MAG: hypothetical protein R3A10_14140 [Caldilineaceae bacterium]